MERARRVLVTGGGSGIGAATAAALQREGCEVLVADLDLQSAQRVAAGLPGTTALEVDVGAADSVAALFEAVDRCGALDGLVHCAGIGVTKSLLDVTPEEWERVLQVNLTGAFLCCTAAARRMVAQGGGSIVVLGSVAGQRPSATGGPYATSKAALELLVLGLALELGSAKVRANLLAPGPTDTELVRTLHVGDLRQRLLARVPLQRYATPEEIAGVAAFLVSDEASIMTGQVLHVDGGMSFANVLAPYSGEAA